MRRAKYPVVLLGLALVLLGSVQAILGDNVDPDDRWAWSHNVGWINFNPQCAGCQGVTVYADHLEGYAWGENVGWIRTGTHTGGGSHTYANDAADNYGVNVDGAGNLSGYAWSQNVGWIDFAPAHGGVTVDLGSGELDGYAWGENIGWIHFKHAVVPTYNVAVNLADLVVAKSVTSAGAGPGQAVPGGAITYTIVFSNAGGGPAFDVIISDTLPFSLTHPSVISSGVVITPRLGPPYAWDVVDLAAGDGGVITISGRLDARLGAGPFTNTVSITTTALDSASGNNRSHAGLTVVVPGRPGYGSDPAPGSTIDVVSPVGGRLTISETGQATLVVTPTLSGAYADRFGLAPTALAIPDGGPAQVLSLGCTPSASGTLTATLSVTHNAPGSPAAYELRCVGAAHHIYLPLMLKKH